MKNLLIIFVLLLVGLNGFGQSDTVEYASYCNVKLNLCVEYLDGILEPQGETKDEFGQTFKNMDTEDQLVVYKENRLAEITDVKERFLELYVLDSLSHSPLFIVMDKPNSYSVHKVWDGKFYYQRTIIKVFDIYTYYLAFDKNDVVMYEKLIQRNNDVFK